MTRHVNVEPIEIVSYRPQAGDVLVVHIDFQADQQDADLIRRQVKAQVGEDVGVLVCSPSTDITVFRKEPD